MNFSPVHTGKCPPKKMSWMRLTHTSSLFDLYISAENRLVCIKWIFNGHWQRQTVDKFDDRYFQGYINSCNCIRLCCWAAIWDCAEERVSRRIHLHDVTRLVKQCYRQWLIMCRKLQIEKYFVLVNWFVELHALVCK